MTDVSAIVVSYNSRPLLERCLSALPHGRCEVLVVDNASTDGSREFVLERFPDVRLLALDENRGFGAASNIGMQAGVGAYFLLVNPDAWPLGGAVDELVAFAEDTPQAGVVGPRLVNEDGSKQRSIFGYPSGAISLAVWATFPSLVSAAYAGWRNVRGRFGKRGPQAVNVAAQAVGKREFLKGAVLLLKREAVERVGGFDERFFLFSEEADLCFRVRQAGWSVMFYGGATFVHVGGASTTVGADSMYAEQLSSYLTFIAKHRDGRHARRARTLLLQALAGRALLARGDRRRQLRRALARLSSPRSDALSHPL